MNISVIRVIRGGMFHCFGAALTLVNDSSVKDSELFLYKFFRVSEWPDCLLLAHGVEQIR